MTKKELKSIEIGQKIQYTGRLTGRKEIWTVYQKDDDCNRVLIKSDMINHITSRPFNWFIDELDCHYWTKIKEVVDLI